MLVVLLAMTFAMGSSFYLGYFSGRHVGHEAALASSAANLAKLPIIPEPSDEQISEEVANDVYAKLNADHVAAPPMDGPGGKEGEMPDLTTLQKAVVDTTEPPPAAPKEGNAGPGTAGEQPKSLGEILAEREAELAAANPPPPPADKAAMARSALETEKPAPVPDGEKSERSRLAAEAKEAEKQRKAEERSQAEEKKRAEERKVAEERRLAQERKVEGKQRAEVSPVKVEERVSKALPKGWFAQVAAPRKRSDAMTVAQKLRGSGFSTIVEEAEVRGDKYYRVLVGPEAERPTAERLVGQLRRESYLQTAPFLKLVK
jgi:cell division septation protein DedD